MTLITLLQSLMRWCCSWTWRFIQWRISWLPWVSRIFTTRKPGKRNESTSRIETYSMITAWRIRRKSYRITKASILSLLRIWSLPKIKDISLLRQFIVPIKTICWFKSILKFRVTSRLGKMFRVKSKGLNLTLQFHLTMTGPQFFKTRSSLTLFLSKWVKLIKNDFSYSWI